MKPTPAARRGPVRSTPPRPEARRCVSPSPPRTSSYSRRPVAPPGSQRAETEWNPDGSVTRTVQQAADAFGAKAESFGETRPTASPDASAWHYPLESALFDAGGGGVLSTGTFAGLADIPPHLVIEPRETVRGELVRDCEVTDHGILRVYDWRETLTAGTTPLRIERARRAAVELAAWSAGTMIETGIDGAGRFTTGGVGPHRR